MFASLRNYTVTWDLALFVMLMAGAFFWGVSRGNNKIKFLIVSTYISSVVFGLLPLSQFEIGLSLASRAVLQMSIFGGMVLMLALLLKKIFRGGDSSRGAWWQTLILCVLVAGFLMTNLLGEINQGALTLSTTTIQLFTTPVAKLWWTALPIVGVLFL